VATDELARPYEPLSPAELAVLDLLASGRSYREIGEGLVVSPNTIKSQLRSIYRKLGVGWRADATRRATVLGLLDGGE
jgi:LuxR family transcriptional regulator, maltose regulon positive regulatory protein